MNNDNLKKFKSVSEARENGKKGGVKSGEKRRQKKSLKEALKQALEMQYKNNGEQVNGYTKLAIVIMKQALKGNTRAFEVIRDTIGERPTEVTRIESEPKGITLKLIDASDTNTPPRTETEKNGNTDN